MSKFLLEKDSCLVRKMKKFIKEFETLIDYNFKNKDLLHQALTHKSFNNNVNNEKLEFLVVDGVVSV